MLREELKDHLTKKILPFWENLKDEGHGGFYGYVDKALNVEREADKGCILHSRILWTFATAARTLGSEEYRAYADWAYEALKMFEDGEHGGVYWSVTYDGKPSDTTKHTYCQAFAIYGLSAYYRLTGKKEALEKARALYRVIEDRCTVYNGYGEAYQADFSPESNEKLSENGVMATRTMNTLLHVVEAYTELHRAEKDEEVRESAQRGLGILLEKMYAPEKHRLEVFMDDDYRPLLDMQSYGHDIESGWLLWDAAQEFFPKADLAPYRAMCLDLLVHVRERAFTDHGLKNEWVDGEVNELRIWWVQAETMLGLTCGWELTGDAFWLEDVRTQWQTIQRMIVDPRENGEWYWSVYEDGSLTERPMVEEWKCPYHNGRMCLRLMGSALPV
ncbi:MAG: AGE family epimerase/isomerase [Clostridia bacterium]|nr:AGE family epimerase/isomerase [Clostridia bacterium]MBR1684644.1 AGE family epimerase/isomerase [Clostridia bacterium]MBR2286846.1 AGE family epimerase/isomerase [Clostridia bacterium]